MQEIRITQELNQRYQSTYDKNFHDLLILNAIVRLPRMSDQLYKTMKRKEQAQKFDKRQKEAIGLMREHNVYKNGDEFMATFLDHLDESIQGQVKDQAELKQISHGIRNSL